MAVENRFVEQYGSKLMPKPLTKAQLDALLKAKAGAKPNV